MKTLRLDDYTLSYAEAGSGPPLLMIHGSLCDQRYWQPQMAAFGATRRAIAPSLRHCWPEAWDGRGDGYSVERHVADLIALIDHLDAGPVDLLGHSRGGLVAYRLALAAPARVRRLVLAEPGGVTESALSPAAEDIEAWQVARVGEAARQLAGGDVEGALARFVDGVSGAPVWARMVPSFQRMARDNAFTLLGQARESRPRFTRDELQSLAVPTLLVGGGASAPLFSAVLGVLEQYLPQARRETLAGAGHAMNLAAPRAFNAAVAAFLDAA